MIRRSAHYNFGGSSGGFHQSTNLGRLSWAVTTPPGLPPECGRHALADRASSLRIHHRTQEISAAFDAIEPVLSQLAQQQFDEGFARRGAAHVLSKLHLDFSTDLFDANWFAPLDIGALHARCIIGTFCRLIEQNLDRSLLHLSNDRAIDDLLQAWMVHAIDITSCADSRLVDAVNYTLRLPPSVVAYRNPAPEALFDVGESVAQWERVELRRWRKASPNEPSSPTRYLKMCVYPFSNEEVADRSCVSPGNGENQVVPSLLTRLRQFTQAVRLLHGEGALIKTLLVGIDTNTDAIRVHVPDAYGNMHAGRHLNGHFIYNSTSALSRVAAEQAIHNAVAACAGVHPNDPASAGMRQLCGYLLKANIAQIDFRREWRWLQTDSHERLIVVGDAFDEEPLRHVAFQVCIRTIEEGAAELDYAINVLRGFNDKRRLTIPLLVHVRTDQLRPGAGQYARDRVNRLVSEVRRRYSELVTRGSLHLQAIIEDVDGTLVPMDTNSTSGF
jgi:carboxysome shell carbonic anhydrase